MELERYIKRLADERVRLEAELSGLGKRNPQNPQDWDLRAPDMDVMEADENETADRAEEAHIDQIVLDELEARYRLVLHAEKKIAEGRYGICEVSGKMIEEDRLNANPAARTCKEHMGKEATLVL